MLVEFGGKVNAKKIQNTLLPLPGTVATLMEIIANHLNVSPGCERRPSCFMMLC